MRHLKTLGVGPSDLFSPLFTMYNSPHGLPCQMSPFQDSLQNIIINYSALSHGPKYEKHPENQLLVSECEIIQKNPLTKAFGKKGKSR